MSNSRAARRGQTRTLDATMRAPSTTTPDVVVVDVVDMDEKVKVAMNPKKDLWLSTADGRHQSPIIPVRVGPCAETFYVHCAVLLKSEYFRKALNGDFQEAEDQAVDLPEEDPAIFSFVVAFLYEGIYEPIRPIADVLVAEPEKGKGKENDDEENASRASELTDTDDSLGSDNSARSRRRRENRRRREQREWEERNRKEPGRHRPECTCATCVVEVQGPPCWNCGVPRARPPPPQPRPQYWYPNGMPHPPPPNPVFIGRNGMPVPRPRHRHRRGSRHRVEDLVPEPRMTDEDLRTWLMAYELSVEVYICAERFLLMDFKSCVHDFIIDQFETAGVLAALPQVLVSCKKLHTGVSNNDALLKKVFARVGFLLAHLWKNYPEETHNFWMENPDVGSLIMKETMERRAEDAKDDLPAMERAMTRDPHPMVEEIIIRERHRGFR